MSRLVRPSVRPTTLPAAMNNEVGLMMINLHMILCARPRPRCRPPTRLRPAVSARVDIMFCTLRAVTQPKRCFVLCLTTRGSCRRCLAFGLLRFPLVRSLSLCSSSLVGARLYLWHFNQLKYCSLRIAHQEPARSTELSCCDEKSDAFATSNLHLVGWCICE